MMTTHDIKAALLSAAQPGRAAAMQAYMRGQFPFLGIATPARRAANRERLKQVKPDQLFLIARELWALPEREYQYTAIDLLAMHHKKLLHKDIPALLALVRQKPWWDTVDGLVGVIGDVLRFQHDYMDQALRHDNFWMRRIALLHQLGWRDKTDEQLLFSYCLGLAHEKEFFIQKAIGWALRDYARHAPESVGIFINENRHRLAPLSYREANKHIQDR